MNSQLTLGNTGVEGTGNVDETTEGSYYEEVIGTIKINGTDYVKKRRTIYCGALPSDSGTSNMKRVDTGIASLNGILSIYGSATIPASSWTTISLPYVDLNSSCACYVQYYQSKIRISLLASTDFSAYSKTYVTVEYY